MERPSHGHAEAHAYAGANGHDAHGVAYRAPGKQTQAELEPPGTVARGSSASLFAGGLPWQSDYYEPGGSGSYDSESESEVDGSSEGDHDHEDGIARAARANDNPYKAGGNRPHVLLEKRVTGTDQDGQAIIVPKGAKPAISAVAGNAVVMYLSGGKFVIVKTSALKRAVSSPSNLERALRIRKLRTRKKAPGGTERTVALPPERGEGWKPAHTGGESLTGRESGIIWGATNETGPDGSGTGYVALPMRTGTKFIVTEEHTNPTQWVRPDGATGKAVWAHGWARVHGKWVKQVMVARIVPDDANLTPVTFLP